jgi:MFS transporter, DHA1 family, inner membrane transport protein
MDVDVPAVPISVVDDVPVAIRESPVASASDTTDRRTLIALCFGTFVAALVFIIPPLFFPQMARDLQVSVPLLGQIMSTMLGLSVVLGLIIGPLSDRSGYRLLILIGLAAATACLLVFGLAPTFMFLLLASAAGAVADAGVLGSSFAIAGTAFVGTAARRAIGWTTAAQAGAAIVGVPLLAAIGTVAGWRVAFVAAGLTALTIVVLATLWLPRDQRTRTGPVRLDTILAPYRPLLRDNVMRRLYGATMVGAVCWNGLLTYLGAFLVEALGLGTGHVGVVYMAAGTGYCIGSLAVGGPLARLSTRRLVVLGYLTTAVLIALAFSAQVGTTGSIVLITGTSLMMGVEGVAMTALMTAETPTGAGTTMTLSGSLFNLGAAGGSAIGGALLAFSGYQALAIGLPIFALGAALLSWRSAPLHVDGPRDADTRNGRGL